jgi:hypothetical protein
MAKKNLSHVLPARKPTMRLNLLFHRRPEVLRMIQVTPTHDELGLVAALLAFIVTGAILIFLRISH